MIHVLEGSGSTIHGEQVMFINQPNFKQKNAFTQPKKLSDFEITFKCLKFEERVRSLANYNNSYHIVISTGCKEIKENLEGLFIPSNG